MNVLIDSKANNRRMETSLDSEVENLMNKQLEVEMKASNFYLACSSWCEARGYANAATYFYAQVAEEHQHMLKFFKYINDVGGYAVAPEVEAAKVKFDNYHELFKAALRNEVDVTKTINKIVNTALKNEDMISFNFLQWFVKEQEEEEESMRRIVDLIQVIGLDGQGVWFIEQEIEQINNQNKTVK